MQELNGWPVEHAGSGVYVVVDAIGVWLHANSHDQPTDRIYLEDEVLTAVLKFRERGRVYLKEQEQKQEK